MHPLDDARLKFDRGSEHVDTLHGQIPRFLKEHSQRVADEFQPQAGSHDRHIYGESTPPLWSILLGEIAHNFRSCLDHIAWQLAIAWSPTGNPEDQWSAERISFPIYSDRRKYLSKRDSAWRHNGVLPQHRRSLRKLQPYQRGDAAKAEMHPFWLLHSLSNIDKHRVLHTTLVGLAETFPAPGQSTTETTIDPFTGEADYVFEVPEGVVMETTGVFEVGGPIEGDVYFEGDLPFQIEIEQPGTVLHEQPVLRFVDGIRSKVGDVLNTFWPLL